MRKRILMIAAGLLLLSDRGLPAQDAQAPTPLPNRFEIYYEQGWGGPVASSNSVETEEYDAFDSAKKVRRYDAQGGQVQYQAELSNSERKAIYDAIRQNDLLAVKNEFTVLGVHPNIVGRLRIEIDGDIKEIRFKSAYGRVVTGDTEWTRLRKVLDVIENILKAKDQQQTLPRHKAYA